MSSTVHIYDDDDDEFDWDAAVKQIDVTFPSSNLPSTSSCVAPPPPPPPLAVVDSFENRKRNGASSSRQSTLDKFVVKPLSKPQPQIQSVVEPGHEKLPNVQIDAEAAKTWIYPVNVPLRDYQLAITEKALFSNTLVALPTGLGKTLIAAVVMYNYFRWFPDGKIVFTAPSRPLVTQQIEACHNIVGIPQEWTIDMTGQISPTNRACLWKSKRVFFVTPQVLEKDIQSGTCLVKYLVCLVIDEAHRAMGKFSYCVAVQEVNVLSAKQQTIQQIIDNLRISTLEYRNESDHDVSKYVHNRKIELIQVAMGQDAVEINNKLSDVIRPYLAKLCEKGVLPNRDFKTLSPCDLLSSRETFRLAPPPNLSQIMIRDMEGYFGLLLTLYHIRKLLSSHGVRPAYEMLEEKLKQGSFARYMSRNEDMFKAKLIMQQCLSHGAPSPKLSKMLEVLLDHFKKNDPERSRVIIFSNFRGSVRDIMDALAKLGNIVKATQFIGQSSGKSSKGQSQKVQQAVLEVPHIYKPTVNYVQISIEKFVRSGKKMKDDDSMMTPVLKENLTDAESNLVTKYFHPPGGITWKPSLIAFPHFQTFPSRVHKVMHSFKTRLLIDAMQQVQGLSFDSDSKSPLMEVEVGFERGLGLDNVEHENGEGLQFDDYSSQHNMETNFLRPETSPAETIETKENHSGRDLPHQSPDGHSYLFGQDFVSIDTFGNILILSVPLLTSKGISHMNRTSESSKVLLHSVDRVSCHLKDVEDKDTTAQAGGLEDLMIPQTVCRKYESPNYLSGSDALKGKAFHGTPSRNLLDEDNVSETPDDEMKASPLPDDYSNDSRDNELSPRLTNMIKSGVVPESPTDNNGLSNGEDGEAYPRPNLLSPAQLHNEIPFKSSNLEKNEIVNMESGNCGRNVSVFSIDRAIQTPSLYKDNSASMRGLTHTSPILDKSCSPWASPTSGSCSKDWGLSIADKSESVKPTRKFKRLRKVENEGKNENLHRGQDCSFNPRARPEKLFDQHKSSRGKKPVNDVIRDFIDEEAEVSADSDMSDDEDDDGGHDDNSHDSFIDDRISPTFMATQSATSRIDMMAVYRSLASPLFFLICYHDKDQLVKKIVPIFVACYSHLNFNKEILSTLILLTNGPSSNRRSLLSQSPMPRFPIGSATQSPNSTALTTRTREAGSYSLETSSTFQTPPTESANHSVNNSEESKQIQMKNPSSEAVPCTTGVSSNIEIDYGGRKRKLSFYGTSSSSIPTLNLEPEFQLQYEAAGGSEAPKYCDKNDEMVCDDEFYEGLDLDEVEAQATLLLKQKAEAQRREVIAPYIPPENPSSPSMPSFDLGI
ncbi:hypothetical protein CsatB_011377 [Cannabis sativa]